MKQIKLGITLVAIVFGLRGDHFDPINIKPYKNHIEKVQVIDGIGRQTVRLIFSNNNPIMMYAPDSFDQTMQEDYALFIAPNTTIDTPFYSKKFQIDQDGKNLKIQVFGKIILRKSIKNTLVMVIEKNISD